MNLVVETKRNYIFVHDELTFLVDRNIQTSGDILEIIAYYSYTKESKEIVFQPVLRKSLYGEMIISFFKFGYIK